MPFVTTTALLAGAFVNSIGINTHLDSYKYGYENVTVVANSLKYLGLHNVRDAGGHTQDLQLWQELADAADVKFDDVMPEASPAGMQNTLNLVPKFAAAGLLNYVEGGNEEDDPIPLSLGNSLAYTAYFQQQVYQVAHGLGLPVINMSFGQGWTAANNWHGNYDKVGNLAAYADYANPHTYPIIADGQPNKTILMLNADALLAAAGRPIIVSEMGWNSSKYSSTAISKSLLNGLLDSTKSGNRKTYIYALFDDSSAFGIMNSNGSPKASGTAIHNLTTLMADSGANASTFKAGTLSYQLSGTTGNESSLLFEKSDGSFWLSVWDEFGDSNPTTLTLTSAAKTVQVYDPLIGTGAIQTASNATSVSLNVTDHPLLVKIVPATQAISNSSVTTPPTTGTVMTSKVSNSTVTGDTSTSAILVYGSGNTITGGPATSIIQAFSGGNTINPGSGTPAINVGGSNNTIVIGTGDVVIHDGAINSTITFSTIGGGAASVYGYALAQGNTLNFTKILAATEWNGSQDTVGQFLKVTTVGSTTEIAINPSGLASGVTYPVATLQNYAYASLSTVLAHAVLNGS